MQNVTCPNCDSTSVIPQGSKRFFEDRRQMGTIDVEQILRKTVHHYKCDGKCGRFFSVEVKS